MVVVLAGALMAVSMPKVATFRSKTELRAAKDHIATQLATARAAAIRRAQPATFNAAGHQIWVTVDSAGNQVTLVNKIALNNAFKTQLSANRSAVTFDARGFAQGLGSVAVFVVARGGARDSVCVSRAGAIMRERCYP